MAAGKLNSRKNNGLHRAAYESPIKTQMGLINTEAASRGSSLSLAEFQKFAHILYRIPCSTRIGCINGVTLAVE
jgi:hypothetical protein